MQSSFYKPQTDASALWFAALAAEVCEPTRTCRAGGNGNESNRGEGKRANDRARLIRECSYSMVSAPWPAFSFTSSIFSSAWGGKEMPVLPANSWVTSKVVVSDGRARAAAWWLPAESTSALAPRLKSEPVSRSPNYLFKIHAVWTVSMFRPVKIWWLMRIVLHGNESYRTKKE